MTQPLETMLPVLRCPRSHTALRIERRGLVSEAGDVHPLVTGKPILVRQVTSLNVTPPRDEHVSRNIAAFRIPPEIEEEVTTALHLGSGDVPSSDPRVISLDVLPCAAVDVVGEAEALPFADHTFDYVESGAVFEHLHDPLAAIREVRRVLKPGGQLRIDTAFLQGYHGYPGHYFNLTPLAIETFLADDFDLELSTVPDSATPIHTVLDLCERFLGYADSETREELLARPLRDVLELLRADETRTNPILRAFDEHPMRALCASFVVVARKPEAYEARLVDRASEGESGLEAWRTSKREYYAARAGVIHRHHEVGFYRRLAQEAGRGGAEAREPEALDVLLELCRPASMLDPEGVRAATGSLRAKEKELTRLRDRWMRGPRSRAAARKVLRELRRLRGRL